MSKPAHVLSITLGVLVACTCIAVADTLKPGDVLNVTFALTYAVVEKPPTDPEKKMSDAEWAKVVFPKTTYPGGFTVTVDRLAADGGADARISAPSKIGPGIEFGANVTPDGQIVPTVDFTAIQTAGIDQNNPAVIPAGYRSWTQAEQTNYWAFVIDQRLLLYNEVALGAGKKKALKAGDAWRIVIPDQNNQTVNFVFQGMQQFEGHDVAVLGITTERMTKKGVSPVSGTALYDLQRHLLVNLHAVGDDDTPFGARNVTVDFVLQ